MSLDDLSRESAEVKRGARDLRQDAQARKDSSGKHIRETRKRLDRGVDRDGLDDENPAADGLPSLAGMRDHHRGEG
jgi:hypothetical protein